MADSNPVSILSTFTAHSNLSTVCRKYGILRDMVKTCLTEEYIEITDVSIPLTNKKSCNKWEVAKPGITDAVEAKLLDTKRINNLLVVVSFSLRQFSEMLADEIINQMKRRYDNQGKFNYLTAGNIFTSDF